MDADIVIKNGLVLTMDDGLTLPERADLAIKGSKIVEIAPQTKYQGKKTIAAEGKLVMPGLINCHTHAAMVMMRGLADDLPLETWWKQFIFPIEKKLLNPEFVKIGVELAALEMIKSGTTAFADMYYFEDTAAEVCKRIGLRAFLGEGILDVADPDARSAAEGLKLSEELQEKWRNDQLIQVVVAPHAPYSCGPETLKQAKKLAEQLNLPICIHVAETKSGEVAELEKIGFLDERVIAVHAVHLSPAEIEALRKRKVKVVHCPESNMKLASGTAPVVDLLQAGVTVGLGTDGAASNNNLDMFGEMETAAKIHKAIRHDPTVMEAKTVLRLATSQAAKVLGRLDLGSLEVGKTADLIILDLKRPHLIPLYNVYSQLVYSAIGSDVETSIINGKIIMENRRLLTLDENATIKQAAGLARKIKNG